MIPSRCPGRGPDPDNVPGLGEVLDGEGDVGDGRAHVPDRGLDVRDRLSNRAGPTTPPSMRDIAVEAGVSVESVYGYFRTKAGLSGDVRQHGQAGVQLGHIGHKSRSLWVRIYVPDEIMTREQAIVFFAGAFHEAAGLVRDRLRRRASRWPADDLAAELAGLADDITLSNLHSATHRPGTGSGHRAEPDVP
jgi:hypothetical protein